LQIKNSGNNSWCSAIKRIVSPAFGRPFMVVGVLFLLNQWGEFTNLVMNMINIFKESNSSIDPQLAPVFVGVVQVRIFILPLEQKALASML
jgi:membrane protein insertase Oxa1/YidC/SpoIIIJ